MNYQEEADKVAQIQREAGWSEESIKLYAQEQKVLCCDQDGNLFSSILMLGAGLSQDNSRFGVDL